jgi:hypothetical protein
LTRLKTIGVTGLTAGGLSLIGFGVAHAVLITPIWSQLLAGTPFVILAGIALAWAFDHLPPTVRNRGRLSGVQFGAVMMATLLPATTLDTALRISGLRRADAVEAVVALAFATATGAAAGWIWTRQARGSVAFGAAALALLMTTHGPLPVAQSAKGLWLSLAIASITLLAGVVTAAAHKRFRADTP